MATGTPLSMTPSTLAPQQLSIVTTTQSTSQSGPLPTTHGPASSGGQTSGTQTNGGPTHNGLEATPEFLAELAEHSRRLETASPQEIIAWAVEAYAPKLTMATAFGPEGCVILHMLAEIDPGTYVFNLDTGYQFKETLELRDKIEQRYGLKVDYKRADTTVEQYEALHGGPLYIKHLIQLTEYVTGLNARIGYPNEHLKSGHIDELTKPVYATCIGLILKGYDDYERNRKQFDQRYKAVEIPNDLRKAIEEDSANEQEDKVEEVVSTGKRKAGLNVNGFWNKFKDNLIDLFKEEEDHKL